MLTVFYGSIVEHLLWTWLAIMIFTRLTYINEGINLLRIFKWIFIFRHAATPNGCIGFGYLIIF